MSSTIGKKRMSDFESSPSPPRKRARLEMTDETCGAEPVDEDLPPLNRESTEDGWDDDDGDNWSDAEAAGGTWSGDDAPMSDANVLQSGIIRTPIEVTQKVRSNVGEANFIPLFDVKCALKGTRIDIALGIRVREIPSITTEQLEVWGLNHADRYIIIKLVFGPYYLNENQGPTVEVGAATELETDAELKNFRLAWTIKERCANSFLSVAKWPPIQKSRLGECPDHEALTDLMEGSQQPYAICLAALRKAKNDQANALTMLMEPALVRKLKADLPSSDQCDMELNEIFMAARDTEEKQPERPRDLMAVYQDADFETQVRTIVEMFEIPYDAARVAIEDSGTYDEAVERLGDPTYKENLIAATTDPMAIGSASPARSDDSSSSRKRKRKKKSRRSKATESEPASSGSPSSSFMNWRERATNFVGLFRRQREGEIFSSEEMSRTIAVMCKHNFLMSTLCFALKTLLNGNRRCMICDSRMPYAGLKPGVCQDPMCTFQHQEMGLGFSLADEIIKRGQICDILLSMLVSACRANRVELFFPRGVRGDGEAREESFLTVEGQPDVTKLIAIAEAAPSIEEMKEWAAESNTKLKQELNKRNCLLYGLLCWVITSNRTHLRALKESELIPQLSACRSQFALASATPEREQIFQDLKRKHGSIMTFHGSPMGNWHSILRMGLKNYSGSKYQMHGAAHGNGIYLATNAQTSVGYCRPGASTGWSRSQFTSSINCMAVCEVIKAPSLKRKPAFGGIYVVPQEEHVVTRFFVLFDSGANLTVNSDALRVPDVVGTGE